MRGGGGRSATTTVQAGELVSLAERMGYLQGLRIGFVAIILTSAVSNTSLVGTSLGNLFVASAAYLVAAGTVEGLRRLGRGRGLALTAGMLLLDGVFLATVMYSSGGTDSVLRFLVHVHVIAVTLLASYRTGLKITVWHTLLYFVTFYAQVTNIVTPVESTGRTFELGANSEGLYFLLAMWAIAIGTAVFSQLNERRLRQQKHDLASLAALAAALDELREPVPIALSVLERACDDFGFRRGAVLAAPEGGDALVAYVGPGEREQLPGPMDPIIEEAWEDHDPHLVKKLDPERDRKLAALFPFARNLIVVPMFAEAHPLGAIVLEHPSSKGSRIERRVVDILMQFASHAALALRNSWLLEQVHTLASTDPLTGLPNRRTFQTTLDAEIARATRSGEPLTLMMVDMDHFKKLNDKYGHQAGDEVLRRVGRVLRESCREFDTPARYGGEEFAVLLPSSSAQDSLVIAERIRSKLSEIEAPTPIKTSAGVATFPTHAGDSSTLIMYADEALYESKRKGRNRITRSRRRGTVHKTQQRRRTATRR